MRTQKRLNIYILFMLVSLFPGIPVNCQVRHDSDPDFGGIVSAATPEAVNAGVNILEVGGNAIDAAVAISFALAVTEPAMSGLGGQTQIMICAPGKNPVVINGTSLSPGFIPANVSLSDIVGHKATTIPSTVRVLEYAWKKYGSGTLTWADLIRQSILYAEEGFIVGPFQFRVWSRHQEDLRQYPAMKGLLLDGEGSIPGEGILWKQPVLAKTLRRLARYGADDFYEGGIARDIAHDMEVNGGWITLKDLKNFPQPMELVPLKGSYRGWTVFTLPPPGGGWVVLQILNILERSPATELSPSSSERLFLLAEALRIGQKQRQDNPVRNLIDYHKDVSEKVSKEFARFLLERERDGSSGETTHFALVDAAGTVVSVTASINSYFGARVASPKLGFLYNNYMREFEIGGVEHPFALRPNAMPYSNMSPTILAKDGKPVLALGSPGSSRIISAVVQVIQLWADGGMTIKEAVASKRIHVVPHRKLYLESPGIPDSMCAEFERRGYTIEEPKKDLAEGGLNPYFGGVHAIGYQNGMWHGAADPRRDGGVKYISRRE